MQGDIVIIRGGGDVASGVIQKIHRAGFRVLILEINKPTSIRRTVCFSEAVYLGMMKLEGLTSILVKNEEEVFEAWNNNLIPLVVDSEGSFIRMMNPLAVIDAIIAKENLGMFKDIAPITIGVGPGFDAGKDVDIVIESNRGHNLGRLIFQGFAENNTGNPGIINGYTTERVLYSPSNGIFETDHNIGDIVTKGEVIATVDGEIVVAKIDGILRGLIRNGTPVTNGFKVGDVDPRKDQLDNCFTISDKARAIGGAVLEALMIRKNEILIKATK